jgi:hypothetical protein
MSDDRSNQRISQQRSQPTSSGDSGFIQVPTNDWLELPDSPVDRGLADRGRAAATIDAKSTHKASEDRSTIESGLATTQYLGRSHQGKGSSVPWWIIIASWILLGLPACMVSLNQLANLLIPMQPQQNAFNEALIDAGEVEFLSVIISLVATTILLSILGQQTLRRLRRDRRHRRFRYRMKHQAPSTEPIDQTLNSANSD